MFPATSMPDRDWWQTIWPSPEETMKLLGVKSNMIATDICCGDGYFTIPLAKQCCKVYGLELDSTLLEQASRYSIESGVTNCQWIEGDAMYATQLITEKVDYVLMANTFHGIPDKIGMLKIIAGLLKTTGKFAIINWYDKPREETIVLGLARGPKSEMRMSPETLSSILISSGVFSFVETVNVSDFHYASIFSLV